MIYEERIEEIDLQRYWLVLKRRWRPATGVFITTVLAAFASAASPESLYQASAKLLLRTDQTAALTGIQDLGELKTLKQTSDPLATQAEIIFSLPILEDTIRVLDLKDAENVLVSPSDLAKNLSVEPLEETDLIAVSYRSGQPELSAAVVNQIMRSYIEANVSSNRSEVTAARRFLEDELPRAKAEADAVSAALRDFDEANNIVALPEEAGAAVAAIANLDNQIHQAKVALVATESQATQLSRQLGMSAQQALALASLNQSPAIQSSLAELQAVRSELATTRTRYTAAHPAVRALERKEAALSSVLGSRVSTETGGVPGQAINTGALSMSSIDEKLAEQLVEAEVARVSNYNQLATLVATRDAYQEQSSIFPGLKKTQTELEQRQASAQRNYETLRLRLQEI